MATQSEIDMLAEQAKQKIQAQKSKLAYSSDIESGQQVPEDIYAEIRDEAEIDEPEIPVIKHTDYGDNDFNIEHSPSDNMYAENEPYNGLDTSAIFEGGPSVSQVELWKKQFSKDKVFHTAIMDKHFVFRTLNRYEYKQIVGIENIDALYREEIICKTCVLFPYEYNFKKMAAEPGGYVSTLAQIIMENSGFTHDYGIEVL